MGMPNRSDTGGQRIRVKPANPIDSKLKSKDVSNDEHKEICYRLHDILSGNFHCGVRDRGQHEVQEVQKS